MTNRRVGLATCARFPELDDDDRLVLPELAARGVRAEPVVWNDPSVDWDQFDLTVIRSTWDYIDCHPDFLAWAESVPRLANPAAVVNWNTDKRYLRDLAEAGVPVVSTLWLERDADVRLPREGRYVIKPAIGAGSRDAGRFDLADADQYELAVKHVHRLLESGATVMVQPYLDAVDTAGETALLFVGGEFSHAIRKAPLLAGPETEVEGLFREEQIAARSPAPEELDVAEAVLAAVPTALAATLLYARVDVLPDATGRPVLLELEVTEPSLFLRHGDRAAGRFADAIGTRLDRVLKTG